MLLGFRSHILQLAPRGDVDHFRLFVLVECADKDGLIGLILQFLLP